MTTSVKIDVNGKYVATVKQTVKVDEYTTSVVTSLVHGRYDGSPNPSGEKVLYLSHPATASFEVTESEVVDLGGGPA